VVGEQLSLDYVPRRINAEGRRRFCCLQAIDAVGVFRGLRPVRGVLTQAARKNVSTSVFRIRVPLTTACRTELLLPGFACHHAATHQTLHRCVAPRRLRSKGRYFKEPIQHDASSSVVAAIGVAVMVHEQTKPRIADVNRHRGSRLFGVQQEDVS